MIDQIPTAVVVTDARDHLLAASPSARGLLGLPGGPIAHVQLRDLLRQGSISTSPHHSTIERGGQTLTLIGLQQELPADSPSDVAQLAGEVAHDFNNLLGVIINFTSMAAADLPADSPISKDLEEVLVAARRGAALTQRLQRIGDSPLSSAQRRSLRTDAS